jgi:hypothetical protein
MNVDYQFLYAIRTSVILPLVLSETAYVYF